jgi:CRISPR-associated protein Csm5
MNGHLLSYDIKLTTRGPLFIGSGRSYNKKAYAFYPKTGLVRIIDEARLFDALADGGFAESYENFILRRPSAQLGDFLNDCGFTAEQLEHITLYTADAADALVEGKTLAEIWQFMRDSRNRPYVPGSSLKGALRTALLMKLIAEGRKTQLDERGRTQFNVEPIYLNILRLNQKKPGDEVNSIMRGISVSDSEPISVKDIILARKDDISVSGLKSSINTIREAIRPGVDIRFKLTLDTSVKGGVDAEVIREAVSAYGTYYRQNYLTRFRLPDNAQSERFENCLVLGGGSGYFGKNIVYPMLGFNAGLKFTGKLMSNKFKKHFHDRDVERGISPHTLKHTTYNKRSWHFGVCGFELEEKAYD